MEATTETQTETIEEQNIKLLWRVLQVTEGQVEKRGLRFGEALYKYRERSEVVPGGTTFRSTLDKLNIPPTTAYRWIAKYEESTGARLPKSNPDNRPSETASYEVKVEVEPTAQASSRDVSSSEDSEPSADDLAPESEPVPIPAPTTTPVVTTEEKNWKQLCCLVERLKSIGIALQQVVDDKAKATPKWSSFAQERAEMVSLTEWIADLGKLI